ncbi:hypothetical protein [Paraburkholderia sp. CNPSo 3281]|uniref:hypothetical protein n=1 Tax=Paraburkholderia sp. CNPSo 3281 TaxID=2940933 RepID=UPI0020B6446F|nr:hypothetical protein [Paraburkholderia sp. CNPSo 3281]MCP3717061.1 hypothetical protein [Paraburkholderia sp. CNPSo 3281]
MTSIADTIDESLSSIRFFVQRELVDTLSGQDGTFEPNREWAVIIKHTSRIRSLEHAIPNQERAVLEEAIQLLESRLNNVVAVLRGVVERRADGEVEERTALAAINEAIADVDRSFGKELVRYYELRARRIPDPSAGQRAAAQPATAAANPSHTHHYYGAVHMGDKFVAKQAGAMGPNARADHNVFQQVNADHADIDLNALAADLARLRTAMKSEDTSADNDEAIGQVASAEKAAKNGDKQGAIEHLKEAGAWAFEVAKKIGVEVAVSALKRALGMGA